MGRRLGGLCCILLLCLATAQAAPQTPYDPALLLWYGELSPTQQQVFDLCYDAAGRGETTVALPAHTAYDDASLAVQALLQDCPELSWLSRYYAIRYYQQNPDIAVQITLMYTGTPGEDAPLAAARTLAASVTGSAEDKALALHDLLCQQTTYGEGTRSHDAFGALVEGTAVCDGYAAAYTLLCRMAGIRCGTVIGTATTPEGATGDHAWNLVDFGDWAMLADVTWDDQDKLGLILHDYYGMSGAEAEATHHAADILPRPACLAKETQP